MYLLAISRSLKNMDIYFCLNLNEDVDLQLIFLCIYAYLFSHRYKKCIYYFMIHNFFSRIHLSNLNI